jgi:GntR family transcriptional regulator
MIARTAAHRAAPAYMRIAAALRERIEAGDLAPHTLVPSERELSRDFGISRMTARQALVVLEGEGAVYRRPPRGTFVAEPRLPLHLGSFSYEIARTGHRPTAKVLWAEPQAATPLVADALELPPGADVHAIQRLRGINGDPLAIETTYYPADLTPGFLQKSLDGSLWDLLAEHYDIHPFRATATIEVITLDEPASRHLAVRTAAPGILLVRRTYDTHGRCIEFARDTYRADRAAFQFDAPIPPRKKLDPTPAPPRDARVSERPDDVAAGAPGEKTAE